MPGSGQDYPGREDMPAQDRQSHPGCEHIPGSGQDYPDHEDILGSVHTGLFKP
jgi:hypothetical protein